jgi:hypothetical protein
MPLRLSAGRLGGRLSPGERVPESGDVRFTMAAGRVVLGAGTGGEDLGRHIGVDSSGISARRCRGCPNGRGSPGTGARGRTSGVRFPSGRSASLRKCARSRMRNATQADVTKALEKFRAAVGRVQTRRYAFEGLCCERWGSANRRGGRKIELPRLFVWLGDTIIVPPSHAGAHSIPRIAEYVRSFRAVRWRNGSRGALSHAPPLPPHTRARARWLWRSARPRGRGRRPALPIRLRAWSSAARIGRGDRA